MECPVKLLMLLIPLAIIVSGPYLIYQAGSYWVDVTGPIKVFPVEVEFSEDIAIEAIVFKPESIRPKESPMSFDVEITDTRKKRSDDIEEVQVNIYESCEYIWVDEATTTLTFDENSSITKIVSPQIVVRNTRPPASCKFTVTTEINGVQGIANMYIPVNAWTGHAIAVAKAIFGFLASLLGLNILTN